MTKIIVLGSCVSRVPLLDGILTEHGISHEGFEIEYYFDKQNIVCAMMPPAFSREQVEQITDTNMNEKYALRSLKQNLNKETLPMLLQASADWVITDFMDMFMAHAKYNDTIFATQALEFYRTELGNELWDIEKVRFLERPFEEWKQYVDDFWDAMVEKYGNDRIILNRFRCNKWYMSKEGKVELIPERFHGPSHPIPELNEAALELEDYIIKKYQPWVIDVSKYFMCDENMWDNLQGAHFEKKYYRETLDYLIHIIEGKESSTYLDNPHLFQLERRGIQEDITLPFNQEVCMTKMDEFYQNGNPLWINLLDKFFIRGIKDDRVEFYMQRLRDEYAWSLE